MRERIFVLLLASGCSFVPTYERPKAPVGEAFPNGGGAGLAAADRGWRDVFGDPRLQALIELGLRGNRNLRVAALNVEALRAQYRIQRSELYPNANGTASVELRRNAIAFGGDRIWRVGAGASWEIDLFGRLRSLNAAALEQYLASEATQRATHLALVGEIATQYLRERAFDEQRQFAERTLAVVTEQYSVNQRLLEAGQNSELDVRTAEAQIHAARAEVHRLSRLRAQAENALVVLIGQPLPANLPAPQPLEAAAVVADLPSGVPSEVLLRRPDIIAAEHTLRSANANIGAARAAFFPTISLTGFAGFASTALAGLFTGGLAWSFSPQLSVPLFTAGRNRANLDLSKVRKQIEVARYEQAIQIAFREVADALVARAALDQQLEAQTARAAAEQKRFDISEMRYRAGIDNYLTVLTAQQDLYFTQQALIEVRLQRLTNLAQLYTALGGGWRES
jgi:multidrug efflux system outer membrane protein